MGCKHPALLACLFFSLSGLRGQENLPPAPTAKTVFLEIKDFVAQAGGPDEAFALAIAAAKKARGELPPAGEPTPVVLNLEHGAMGDNGEQAAAMAAEQGVRLEVVSLPEAKKGFVLLPRRWVVERSLAWLARCRRLARDDERLSTTLAGLHYVAAAMLMLTRLFGDNPWQGH